MYQQQPGNPIVVEDDSDQDQSFENPPTSALSSGPTSALSSGSEFQYDEFAWMDQDSDYLSSFSLNDYNDNSLGLTSSATTPSSTASVSRSVTPSVASVPVATIPPVPFPTPPKLKPVEQVLAENTGTDVLSL